MSRPRAIATSVSGLIFLVFCASCGIRHFSVGSAPFPAPAPVFMNESGEPMAGLPDSAETYRLVFLDHAWCPPCSSVWKALKEASTDIPPGSVRVYRILFDRERLMAPEGVSSVPPFRPAPPADAGSLPVTTLIAIQDAFKKQYRPEQAPLLVLTDKSGKVLKKWTGASASLSGEIVSEVRRLSNSFPRPET